MGDHTKRVGDAEVRRGGLETVGTHYSTPKIKDGVLQDRPSWTNLYDDTILDRRRPPVLG